MIPAQSSGATSSSPNSVGQRVGVGLVDHRVGRVAAVDVPAGEARVEAQVLAPRQAERGRSRRCGPSQGTPMRSPSLPARACRTRVARRCQRPRAPASPARRRGARSPSARWRSVRQTPHTRTRTSTCRGPGLGDGLVDPDQRAAVDGAGPVDGPRLHEGRHRHQRRTRAGTCQRTFGPRCTPPTA